MSDAIGAAINAINAKAGCMFLSLLPPPQKAILDMNETADASIAAILETRISLFLICESSWANTPSSSSRFNKLIIPVVTATLAFFGFLPVANAFG